AANSCGIPSPNPPAAHRAGARNPADRTSDPSSSYREAARTVKPRCRRKFGFARDLRPCSQSLSSGARLCIGRCWQSPSTTVYSAVRGLAQRWVESDFRSEIPDPVRGRRDPGRMPVPGLTEGLARFVSDPGSEVMAPDVLAVVKEGFVDTAGTMVSGSV